jgi:hypothetical protein
MRLCSIGTVRRYTIEQKVSTNAQTPFSCLVQHLQRLIRFAICVLIVWLSVNLLLGVRDLFVKTDPPRLLSDAWPYEGSEEFSGIAVDQEPGSWVIEDSPWQFATNEAGNISGNGDLSELDLAGDLDFASDRDLLQSMLTLGANRQSDNETKFEYRLQLGDSALKVKTEMTKGGIETIMALSLVSASQSHQNQSVNLQRRRGSAEKFPLPLPSNAGIVLRRYGPRNDLQLAIAKGCGVDDLLRIGLQSDGVKIKRDGEGPLTVEHENRVYAIWNLSTEHRMIAIREVGAIAPQE